MSESTVEERERAKILAAYILDRVNADPDDDRAVLARQFLRECERSQAEHDAALEEAAKVCEKPCGKSGWERAQMIRALKESK